MGKTNAALLLLFLSLIVILRITAQVPAKGLVAPGSTSRSPTLADMLIAKEKSLLEAGRRKDLDLFRTIASDDFLEIAPDAKIYTKDQVLEGLNEVNLDSFSMYDVRVLPLNSEAAVVTYDAIINMKVGDEPAPRYQHFSSIWVKQGAEWRLKFQQATASQ